MTRLGEEVPPRLDTALRRVNVRTDRAFEVVLRRWAPGLVLLVAAVARFWDLAAPRALIFDETYYVKDAWSLWHLGYEGAWPRNFNDALFSSGRVDLYSAAAEYVAHPPLGKWIIAVGEVLAGGATNSFGWRVSTAVVGVIAVGLLMVLAHRLFATPSVTAIAGGLLAIDNQAIVLSRVALLDNSVMLFALVAVLCLVEDRFWAERRVDLWLLRRGGDPGGWGPTLLWRPWLLGMGVCLGLDSAVKWSGVYFLAAFAVYSVATDMMLRRRAGIRFWWSASILKQSWATALATLPIALVSYLACFTGHLLTNAGYGIPQAGDGTARFTGALAWVPLRLQDLWNWHTSIYAFHIGLDSAHRYDAPARLWLLIARPTSMYWDQNLFDGKEGCRAGQCAAAITDLPNPLIWYAAVGASIYLLVRYVRTREWQAGLLLLAIAAGYLPWLAYPDRTTFFFYSIDFEPYLLLSLAATIGLVLGGPQEADSTQPGGVGRATRRTARRRGLVIGFLSLALLASIFFYPLSTGIPTSYWFWHIHMWSPTWI